MSELNYAQFDLIDGTFIIEDVAYDWSPDGWQGTIGEDALRGDTVRTLTHTRKNTVQPARTGKNWYGYVNEQLTGSATNLYLDARYVIKQVWTANWGQAFMDWCMRDHLMTLYTLQKAFWLRFDDEMSRVCATLQPAQADDLTKFVTPTYPIAFYRAGDPDGQYSQDHLYYELRINNIVVDWQTRPYRIDHEIGLVVFETALASTDVVTLKYLWRAYVRIKEINLNQLEMAQHLYTGTVVFEQLEPPLWIDRFDELITGEPCRECPGNKRIGEEEEICPGGIGPAAARQGDESLTDWANVGNIRQRDGSGATVTLALSGDLTEQLIGHEFNLPTPGDATKRLSRFVGTVYATAANANIQIESLRLVYRDVLIGPNKADGSNLALTYQFEISIDELAGYQFDFDDFANGFFGIAVQYTSSSNGQAIGIDYIELSACWEDTDEEEPPPTDCGCDQDGPPTESIQNTALTCTHREDTVIALPYSVPSDHYVHGVEIISLIEGANRGCAEPPDDEASVSVRLKLNTTPSTFSSWFTKSHQPVRVVDHAYLNYLDATTDYSWGGRNDCWGKPIGGWSPALVNANGFKLEVVWDTACNPNLSANWTYTRTYDGDATGETSAPNQPNPPFAYAWGSGGLHTSEELWEYSIYLGDNGFVSVLQDGTCKHEFTWIGAGDPPSFIDIEVTAYAFAAIAVAFQDILQGDNGLGDPFIIDSSGKFGVSEGTHVVRVPVVGGVAEYIVPLMAYAHSVGPWIEGNAVIVDPHATATVSSSAQISPDSCVEPVLENVDVVVHHSSVCELGPNCYQEATTTGWPTTYKGLSCGLAQSSEGSSNGAFTLLANRFEFPAIGANSRIVGIKVTGEYRVNPSYVRAGNMTLKAHIGSYSGARTGKNLAYPQTNEWTAFSVGNNGDFWDYGAVFSETGVTYPTATGAQLNSFFKLELIGDNDIGYAYEFRNIKVTIYFFDVCDGY